MIFKESVNLYIEKMGKIMLFLSIAMKGNNQRNQSEIVIYKSVYSGLIKYVYHTHCQNV